MSTEAARRAELLVDVGRLDEAERILAADPDTLHDAAAMVVLARVHYQRDDYRRCEDAARVAHGLNPDLPHAWIMKALALQAQTRLADAVEAARRAVAADADHAGAHATLARILGQLGIFESALHHAHTAIQLSPDMAHPWVALARVQLARRQWSQADSSARAALAREPEHPEARILLSAAQQASGTRGRDAAIRTLADGLRTNPDQATVRRLLIDLANPLGAASEWPARLIMIMGLVLVTMGAALVPLAAGWPLWMLVRWRQLPPEVRRLLWADPAGRRRVVGMVALVAVIWTVLGAALVAAVVG